MNYAKIIDLLNGLWHCICKMLSVESAQDRADSARVTHNRLKVLQNKKYMPQVLEFLPEQSKIAGYAEENRVPLLHEFKEVLGVEPVIPLGDDGQSPLSHISQYRLAVYVAGLSDRQKAQLVGEQENSQEVLLEEHQFELIEDLDLELDLDLDLEELIELEKCA